MTKIEIFRKNGSIIKYKATGHSEYDEYGKDIVCSAISTILQYPLAGMLEVLEIFPKFEINSDGYLEVDISKVDRKKKEKELDTLLESMFIMVKSLSQDYPKNIKLVEKEEK